MENQLEKTLDAIKKNGRMLPADDMMKILEESSVILPAKLNKNTPPDVMRFLVEHKGKNISLPQGVAPEPCILQNAQGEKFLPVFSRENHMLKGTSTASFPLHMSMNFQECMKIAHNYPELIGVVINPYTTNLMIRINEKSGKTIADKIPSDTTLEQYHALARRQFESTVFPRVLYKNKANHMRELADKQAEFLLSLYEDIYSDKIANPYVADDFDFICLNIRDDFQVIRISMPVKNRFPQLSHTVVVGYDSTKDKMWYYAFVYEGKETTGSLVYVNEEGEPRKVGDAPEDGQEINTAIKYMEES